MNPVEKTVTIFKRYDIERESVSKTVPRRSVDHLMRDVIECVVEGNDEQISRLVIRALETKTPQHVMSEGLIPGMNEVSRLWETGSYFLPQVILSSDTMLAGIALCEKGMGEAMERKGKVITHTVEGDIHDLGQKIVNALLIASGFEIIDLGANIPVDQVVHACKVHRPIMLTGTALMTTTMGALPHIATKLKEENLNIPFVCGGGAVSEEFVTDFELGIWGKDASWASGMAEDALKGVNWHEMRSKWNG